MRIISGKAKGYWMEFRDRLKELRHARHLSQKAVAKELKISERALQSYEYGERFPDFQGLIHLADYFNVSLDYLVGRSDVRERQ